ncbi:hypothetical protein B296_00004249 [Ensete ventricosum]|uniref:Uncharacterized protein n=1 Tax=Ensete ventricosum TaxID=4639 RepID=A0A427B4Z7_ENSVE|nr:hypothetical protein B296_00004249 [Ensete ventricosum]
MPKVSVGKPMQATRATASASEVKVPVEAAPRTTSTLTPKRPAKGSTSRHEDSGRAHKRVKVTVGKHKSWCSEGSSWVHSKDKEPFTPSGELVPPAYYQSKSMKELCGTTVHKNDEGYHALTMTDLPPRDPDSEM